MLHTTPRLSWGGGAAQEARYIPDWERSIPISAFFPCSGEERHVNCATSRLGRTGAPCLAHRPCLGEFGLPETENRPVFAQRPGLGEIAGFLTKRAKPKPQVASVLLDPGSPKAGS